MTIGETLQAAKTSLEAGRTADAERIYRQILEQVPDNVDALHFLGIAAFQSRRLDEAEVLIRRAIHRKPDFSDAYVNLGIVLQARGKLEEAIAALGEAVRLNPHQAESHFNLGNVLNERRMHILAIESLKKSIELNPNVAKAHNNLGVAFLAMKRFEEASECFRQSLKVDPDYAEGFSNLGSSLGELGRYDESIAACRRAIQIQPNLIEGHINLGMALRSAGRLLESVDACREAVRLAPDTPIAYRNLGFALLEAGRSEEAEKVLREAVRLDPNVDRARWNLAMACFTRRNDRDGWKEFEATFDLRRKRVFSKPKWAGQDAAGKTILIHTELGLGDNLSFVRLIPKLRIPGARIILECEDTLVALFRSVPGIEKIIVKGDVLPEYDWHLPMVSLPRLLGVTLEENPGGVPYLIAPPERVLEWSRRVEPCKQFKVGLVWAGSTRETSVRSRTLKIFRSLAAIPGLNLFSLQKDAVGEQELMQEMKVIDFTADLHDFADTAALMENLDLVISVDTAAAHLAGALARPVWVLIPSASDFRWMKDRADSPWYPTMRLFRQKTAGDWREVSEDMANELVRVVQMKGGLR